MFIRLEQYELAHAEPHEVSHVARLEAEHFGIDPQRESSLRGWYEANPRVIHVVRDSSGNCVGCVNLLPVHEKTWKAFLEGVITERQIFGSDLFHLDQRDAVRQLYVESLIIPQGFGGSSLVAAQLILGSLEELIGEVAFPTQVETVAALVASEGGRRWMTRLGLKKYGEASTRTDGRDFYVGSCAELLQIASRYRFRESFTEMQ